MAPTRKKKRTALKQRLNVVIYPAPDIKGQWISHCLELDVISQGSTRPQAIDMICEAIEMLANANAAEGQPPLEFRSAPAEVWRMFDGAEEVATRILRFEGPITDEVSLAPYYLKNAG